MLTAVNEDNYLRQRGYVFIDISLFASRITQKLLNQFSQNLVERWHMDHERNH